MNFTLREVPKMFTAIQELAGWERDDFDFVVMHQANLFMLEALRKKMKIDPSKAPYYFTDIGNTVSSTIPFVLAKLFQEGQITPGKRASLLGFGVGLSWAGCTVEF
jgi:3-oxoacyl-[acyl-carrier-protein] synthase III